MEKNTWTTNSITTIVFLQPAEFLALGSGRGRGGTLGFVSCPGGGSSLPAGIGGAPGERQGGHRRMPWIRPGSQGIHEKML